MPGSQSNHLDIISQLIRLLPLLLKIIYNYIYAFVSLWIYLINIITIIIWYFQWNHREKSDLHCVCGSNVNHQILTKNIFFFLISKFGLRSNNFDGLNVSDITPLDGNLFSNSNNTSIYDLVIWLIYILNGTPWNVALARNFILHIDPSIIPICSFLFIYV